MANEPMGGQMEGQAFLQIEKIYVKDFSLESPHTPFVFTVREMPQVQVDLRNESRALENDRYECQVIITVSAVAPEKTFFVVEVAQAGLFHIGNVAEEHMPLVLEITCPNILFPYAREAISDVVTRAGFPPVVLNPVNFEALYLARAAEQAGTGQGTA